LQIFNSYLNLYLQLSIKHPENYFYYKHIYEVRTLPRFLKSTIVLKIVMALTGLAICGFITVHAIGNFQYWLGPDTYNTYAALLQGLGELLWLVRAGLLVCIILHIISAVYLRLYSNEAKPTNYHVKNYVKATINKRTMLWAGVLIACGVTFHILHFTAGALNFENGYNQQELTPTATYGAVATSTVVNIDGDEQINIYDSPDANENYKIRHDVYGMVTTEFANPVAVFVYIVFVFCVAFHLSHAIQSGLHTLGIQGRRFTPFIRIASIAIAFLIFCSLCILPVGVYAKSLLGCCIGGM
jgi:succinate dehydrogenase / fumarate reductase cytochrome b subunit